MRNISKLKILVFSDWFEPGFKAGGPIRSLVNLSIQVQWQYDIYIITSDTDFGDKDPYTSIEVNKWTRYDQNINILYLSKTARNYKSIKELTVKLSPNVVYINSMWSQMFSIYPLLILRNSQIRVVLAPRGMLKRSAIQIKWVRKKLTLWVFKLIYLHKNVVFHATDKVEELNILEYFRNNKVNVLSNFPCSLIDKNKRIIKRKGYLKLVVIARLAPIKNLKFLLKIFLERKLDGVIELDVFGPVQNEDYYNECMDIINKLDKNIIVKYKGILSNHKVQDEIVKYHFFVLPTLGENFGHAIFESFASGRPVLISRQTPWRDLEIKKVGFDLSLNKPEDFAVAINFILNMNQELYDLWSLSSLNYAKDFIEKSNLKNKYITLFS